MRELSGLVQLHSSPYAAQSRHVPHQQEARVAARKIFQRGDRGRERQVLQGVPAQDEVVSLRQRALQVTRGHCSEPGRQSCSLFSVAGAW